MKRLTNSCKCDIIKAHLRKPFELEYVDDDFNTKTLKMYINPSKMVVSTAKIKTKQHTRNGIFYHYCGDEHHTLNLSGTTGFSGMKGIQDIENIYMHTAGPADKPLMIYTEDQIFECKMASFTYQCVAETPLINYDLKLDIIKTI